MSLLSPCSILLLTWFPNSSYPAWCSEHDSLNGGQNDLEYTYLPNSIGRCIRLTVLNTLPVKDYMTAFVTLTRFEECEAVD